MVNDKKLEGISDIRDESDRDGMRIVVELRRDSYPQVVLNNLFKPEFANPKSSPL